MVLLDGELHTAGRDASGSGSAWASLEQDADAFGMPEPPRITAGPALVGRARGARPASGGGRRPLELLVESGGRTLELPLGALELVDGARPAG